jgi:enoyl-CoA hydratase/carnithine racemase
MSFDEILYAKKEGVATITINRPKKYNACTPVTIYELSQAFMDAWVDTEVGVVVFTGAGAKAFCTGGDQSLREKGDTKAPLPHCPWRSVAAGIPPDPHSSQAGHRQGQWIRHRRGKRLPGGVRSVHRL